MNTQWGDAEDDALQGLPHLGRVIYLQCLRRYMDYTTGIVGIARKISYQMIREVGEVIRERGSTLPDYQPNTAEIRTALKQLENKGLVVRLATARQFDSMRFRLPLAVTVSIRPDEEQQMNNREPTTGATTGTHQDSARDSGVSTTKATTEEQQGRNNNHQVSGKDRQIDMGDVPSLGDAIQMLIDGGVHQSVAISPSHRIRTQDLIKAGATREIFLNAIKKAQMAKQGQPFSVFYLSPIVNQLLNPTDENNGGQHGRVSYQLPSQSSSARFAEVFEDALSDMSSTEEECDG